MRFFLKPTTGRFLAFSALFLSVLTLGFFILRTPSPPSFQTVRSHYSPSDSWIVDRNGVPLESIRKNTTQRMLDWTSWSEVSPNFQKFLVDVEDHRFFNHRGVDYLALGKGLLQTLSGNSRRGASTLTMQLINLLPEIRKSKTNIVIRKMQQILTALKLENTWTKNEILETYINSVSFRGEIIGLQAASFGFFSKSPAALNDIESALLIASIRAPNAPINQIAKRACKIILNYNCEEIRTVAETTLAKPYRLARSRELVPIYSKAFIKNKNFNQLDKSGLIQTTLDGKIQAAAIEIVRDQLAALQNRNVHDAAVIVLDTKTGAPLAYVGNGGPDMSSAFQVDGVQTLRQAGSTLKPFVYATAFDLRFLEPTSLIEDSPEDFPVGNGGIYSPHDYEPEYQGYVSAAEALASSLNVPAVRAVVLVKERRILDRMRELGFTNLKEDDHYGPSLALGTVDLTLLELTQAYRQLSLYSDSKIFSDDTKKKIFLSLSRPEYRRFTFGLDSLLSLPFPAAVKTGTSKDMRDNWCLGFTSEFTVGVWVGNFDGSSMWNVSGLTGAAPIWRRLMLSLHKTAPKDAVMSYQPPEKLLEKSTFTKIKYPQWNMLIGYDQDIPKSLQKLRINIEHPKSGQNIYVDGKKFGIAKIISFWPVKKGRHKLELRSANNLVVDQVKFTVR